MTDETGYCFKHDYDYSLEDSCPICDLVQEKKELMAILKMVKDIIDLQMKYSRPCPLCGHHYIHTTPQNKHEWDREGEISVCPYPIIERILEDENLI